jgi:hypothetical protein
MKAVVIERYGTPDVLELRDVAEPALKAGEVLVRVRAASVNDGTGFCSGDQHSSFVRSMACLCPRHRSFQANVASGRARIDDGVNSSG